MSPVVPVISPGGAINGGTLRTGTRHPRCSERTPEPTHPPGARKVPLWQEAEGGPQPGCHSCSAHASPNPHAPRQVQRHGGGSGAQSQQEPRCVSCAGEEPPASCDRLRPAFTVPKLFCSNTCPRSPRETGSRRSQRLCSTQQCSPWHSALGGLGAGGR